MLADEYGYNVFMLEYRGYGFSSGDPNEKGLTIDASVLWTTSEAEKT